MGIINRIGLLLFTMINVIVLLTLAIISPRWYSIYQAYSTEKVFKFLYGKEKDI